MTSTSTSDPGADLRRPGIPDHLISPERPARPGNVGGWLVAGITAVGVAVVGVLVLIASPLVAAAAGLWQVVTDVRENAVRPRPFIGARHGFPFLDPPAARAPDAGEGGHDDVNPYSE